MKLQKTAIIAVLLFTSIWALLLPGRLGVPPSETFSHDPGDYNKGAIHIVKEHMYSLDGIHPSFEREPGYSVFLAGIYSVFGLENRLAIFAVQGILCLLSVLLLAFELRRHLPDSRIPAIFLTLFVFLPSMYHTVFSAYRENFALSLAMLFAVAFLRLLRRPTPGAAALAGLVLGVFILTYVPYLFFPLFLLPIAFVLPIPRRFFVLLLGIPFLIVLAWMGRNALQGGGFRLAAPERTAIMIAVRGEQAEHIRGLEPLRCLWAEYISRDWSGRSPQCSFNGVMHGLVDSGKAANPAALAAEGKAKILHNLPWYLWFSVVDIIELHLPYVNGWGFIYNALAALSMVVLYLGALFSCSSLKKSVYTVFLLLALYTTVIFILTDATPRYLLPVIFCYVVFAAVGYDRLITRLRR